MKYSGISPANAAQYESESHLTKTASCSRQQKIPQVYELSLVDAVTPLTFHETDATKLRGTASSYLPFALSSRK